MFPASKSGNINIFALPCRGLPGAFLSATSGIIAASNWISPSHIKSGAFSFNNFVASITLSVNGEWALPCVEYESIATFGSSPISSLKLLLDDIAISDKASASGYSFNPESANINTPSSPNSLSGNTITKNADTNFVPGAAFKIWRAGLNVSEVGCDAPETNPSASPSFTIIVAKYLLFVFNSSFAWSKVIPLFFLNSYKSLAYLLKSAEVAGFTIWAPFKFILFFSANSFISCGLPIKIILAKPSFRTISVASRVRKSSLSGSTIVLMSCFACIFIFSINVMFIFPPIST